VCHASPVCAAAAKATRVASVASVASEDLNGLQLARAVKEWNVSWQGNDGHN
jgi:hypothetical protein